MSVHVCENLEPNKILHAIVDGKIWLQAKSNKEHFYMLTEEVSIGFVVYTTERKEGSE